MAEFAARALELNATVTRVIATSAARDALNQGDLVTAIRQASGLPVEILSGEQEADWAFRGVISDPVFASHPLLIVDAGGGSTEFILGEGDRQRFRHSFRLGTVRLIEQLPLGDPPARADWDRFRSVVNDFLAQQIRPVIQAELGMFPSRAVQLVGTGGTPGILARIALKLPRFNREKIEAVRLTLQTVQQQRERLWAAPLAERKNIAGLPPGFSVLSPLIIQAGHLEAKGTINASLEAAAPTEAEATATKVTATALIDGQAVTKEVNNLGKIGLAYAYLTKSFDDSCRAAAWPL